MRRFVRLILRFMWLCAELLLVAGDFAWLALRHTGMPPLQIRTRWVQRSSRRVLRILAVEIDCQGPIPSSGLLVSNHLSYLDILVFSSRTPAVFVANSEIKYWPVFGWFVRLAGTIFVERTRRSDVAPTGAEIARVLGDGHLVVLFPEGTSSNGRQVLPFKSSLFEPVARSSHRLYAAGITYALTEGLVEDDLCFWGDMVFFPHVLRLMTRGRVRAWVRFAEVENTRANRKDLARQLHAEVVRLKSSCSA